MPAQSPEYLLGHSGTEVQRLMITAEILRPLTERVFRDAGIREGMRVLDVGCGPGDVSLLVSQMVGPNGSVVGIDRLAEATSTAARRAQELGVTNATFINAALNLLENAPVFDAVVGRLFLHHQPDPVLAVKQAAAQIRSGGLIVFHELDLSLRVISSWPAVPLYERARAWTVEALIRSGLEIDIGKKLYHIFKAAGFPGAQMRMERVIGPYSHSAMATKLTELVRTLLAQILEFGVATEGEIQLDTLAGRLEADLDAADAIMLHTPMVGAWVRKQ